MLPNTNRSRHFDSKCCQLFDIQNANLWLEDITWWCCIPGHFLELGALLIVETPTSLIERGKTEEGSRVLKKIRGVKDVKEKYTEIFRATETAKKDQEPF